MSCVVALKDAKENKIYIGADSAISTENEIRLYPYKLLQFKHCVIGVTGSLRVGNIVKKMKNSVKSFDELYDHLWDLFLQHEVLASQPQPVFQGALLIIMENTIYEITSDFGYSQHEDYAAIGSGAQYALGSLFSTRRHKNFRQRLYTALEASSVFSPYVAPPFNILEVGY